MMKKILITIAAACVCLSMTALADTAAGPYPASGIGSDNTDMTNPCGYIELNSTWYAFPISATGENATLLEDIKLVRPVGSSVGGRLMSDDGDRFLVTE